MASGLGKVGKVVSLCVVWVKNLLLYFPMILKGSQQVAGGCAKRLPPERLGKFQVIQKGSQRAGIPFGMQYLG